MNGDYERALNDCNSELERILHWINKNPLDSNVRFLVSYSVIKSCGTIESILKNILFDYLSNGAVNETKNYLQKYIIEASFNPSTKQIANIFEKINSSWSQTFLSQIKEIQEKQDLNSLVELRNSFAHGSQITASIQTVKRYFLAGRKILEIVNEILNP